MARGDATQHPPSFLRLTFMFCEVWNSRLSAVAARAVGGGVKISYDSQMRYCGKYVTICATQKLVIEMKGHVCLKNHDSIRRGWRERVWSWYLVTIPNCCGCIREKN